MAFTVNGNFSYDSNLTWSYMDGDDGQQMYMPDEIATSGLLSKSASWNQIILALSFSY